MGAAEPVDHSAAHNGKRQAAIVEAACAPGRRPATRAEKQIGFWPDWPAGRLNRPLGLCPQGGGRARRPRGWRRPARTRGGCGGGGEARPPLA